MPFTLQDRVKHIQERILHAAQRCGRNEDEIGLVAVSKTKPANMICEAVDAGATIIGENYIQEAQEKFNALIDLPVQWHFIGHLQSNKAKFAVRIFDLIHSVDSLKLAMEINKQAGKAGKIQHILIQVNISQEATKSGMAEEETLNIIHRISRLDHICIKGLMTMPPFFNAPEKARPYFIALRKLRDRIRAESIPNVEINELSMGMTNDFEVAVEEGSTLVRIGTAIFGERN